MYNNNGPVTPRERVSLALAHQTTDRIPMGHIGVFHSHTIPCLEAYLGVEGEDAIRERLGLDDRAIRVRAMVEETDESGERRMTVTVLDSAVLWAKDPAFGDGI